MRETAEVFPPVVRQHEVFAGDWEIGNAVTVLRHQSPSSNPTPEPLNRNSSCLWGARVVRGQEARRIHRATGWLFLPFTYSLHVQRSKEARSRKYERCRGLPDSFSRAERVPFRFSRFQERGRESEVGEKEPGSLPSHPPYNLETGGRVFCSKPLPLFLLLVRFLLHASPHHCRTPTAIYCQHHRTVERSPSARFSDFSHHHPASH